MKLPAFQFYPGDWMKDANLRRCSAAARGVWIDLLCLMFESEERGKLVTSALPWTLQECAEAITGDPKQNLELIHELLRKGVARQDENGALYSKRLIADEKAREKTKNRVHEYRSRNASCNGTVTPSVTPRYEDEDEGFKRSKNPEPPQPDNSEEVTLQIFQAHPGNSHLGERISPAQLRLIVGAIDVDGAEKVLKGTQGFAAAMKKLESDREREMTPGYQSPEKFFEKREYLKPKYQPAPAKKDRLGELEMIHCRRNRIPTEGRELADIRKDILAARRRNLEARDAVN